MPEVSETELFRQAPLIRFDQPGSIRETSIVDRLIACSQSAERDGLLREHLSLNEKIDTFIAKIKRDVSRSSRDSAQHCGQNVDRLKINIEHS